MIDVMTFNEELLDQLGKGNSMKALFLFSSKVLCLMARHSLVEKVDAADRRKLEQMQQEVTEFLTIAKSLPKAPLKRHYIERQRRLFFCASQLANFLQTTSSGGRWTIDAVDFELGEEAVPQDIKDLMVHCEFFES
ncbi:hypothetical protein RPMA_19130 [Tardiphaga alba]|uniref:Uncharacterized protein n=1 Tax=Tardiphaga alba TaxID=340268 RepID=A0ABX8AAB2_9BRAD|nr:hypothetical protein [Tardiphaga alba]QUS40709.1 hypothetical protein RPMA_19130 [Tardiphaga alba]